MRLATVQIEGIAPLQWGRKVMEDKIPDETEADYEKRLWREKFHRAEDGELVIPGMAFKCSIFEAAKSQDWKIPNRGNSKYTKFFERGLLPEGNALLGVTRDDLRADWRFVPSDGKKGGPKRVDKCFPTLDEWATSFRMYLLADDIPKEKFEKAVELAGTFVGVGLWRPQNGGCNGRFRVIGLKWEVVN